MLNQAAGRTGESYWAKTKTESGISITKTGSEELITPVEVSEVMHNIGDKNVFATEFRWDKTPHLYRPWMYGVFCVYINGERLGSPTNQATLSDILVGLNGCKGAVGQRSDPVLMEADAQTAFFSMENEVYGLEHVEHLLPSGFQPLPVRHNGPYQIPDVDGLEDFKVYCVEDETTSRLLYCRMWEHVKECRIPRKIFNDVMFRTIDQLEEWFSQLPEDPARK